MEEKTTKRREWVKNTAIIFLSVMLVLTFFSNTIMNYSLPEVATQYVQSGSITAKIRGTGTVEASDPYNLVINDTRVIESVSVKAGDDVEKGDTIFVLESKESEELKTAKEELVTLETALDNAILAYETKILDGTLSAGTIAGVQSGNVESLKTAQARVQAAKDKVKSLQDTLAGYKASLANLESQETLIANNSAYDAEVQKAALNSANAQLETEKAKLEAAKSKLEAANANRDAVAAQVSSLESSLGGRTQAQAIADAEQAKFIQEKAYNVMINAQAKWEKDKDGICDWAQLALSEQEMFLGLDGQRWEKIKADKEAEYDQALEAYNSLQQIVDNFIVTEAQLVAAKQELANAEQAVASCSSEIAKQDEVISNLNATIANLSSGSSSADLAAQQKAIADQKAQLNASITQVTAEIEAAQAEQTQILADVAGELNLESQNAEIARAREKVQEKEAEVAKLEEEQENPVITAPVSGKITSLSYAAGETTKPGENAAVIQVAGKGFTLSFSVTNDQAKKVSAGDVAELQNSWYYNDVQATLSAIKPDTTNPSQNKLLVFDVTGEDVTAGQSLSLSVGQKSANYDLIVPNSAIREDKNGKFILIVESKSSPLGNRYFATRVDVEVLASDDTQTAISGALYGYEYVITTSTKPVEAGKQVRLTD